MKDAVIFDMDGTLCDVSGVRHLVRGKRRNFDAFHAASVDCPPHAHVVEGVEQARRDGLAVVIVTARKLRWRYHTIVWLKEHGVAYDELYMRADDDDRQDVHVKAQILRRMRRDGFEPVMAWDDNPAVIALWEQRGIPVTLVPGWDA